MTKQAKEIQMEMIALLTESFDVVLKSKSPVVTYFEIASGIPGSTLAEVKDFIQNNKELDICELIIGSVNNSFYMYSLEKKIAMGIDMYIKNELIVDDPITELKVIVDIDEYQKQLQPFTINQESKEIQNKRDEITSIELTGAELEEMGVVVDEEEGEN